ncbi:hypothetical protein BKA70DRAFT_1476670 [Coprinopsis sp. MPI-PUGE-AT-0042]|nr:hypothetical protein BKA70DRAFT_1476670 [Coprinopsis sp. MPI-PUGE-AT-0042]
MACIKSLPTELLNEVFVRYTLSKDTSVDASNLEYFSRVASGTRATRYGCIAIPGNPQANPIVLGHVSSQWRALSLSMPILWSTIAILQPRVKDIPIVKAWFERSAVLPLDLKVIQAFPGDNGELDGLGQGILHLVLQERHRWQRIDIRLFSSTMVLIDFPSDLGTASTLESIKLDLINCRAESSLGLCEMLFSSPVLRTAEFKMHWTHRHTNVLLKHSTRQITKLKFNFLDSSSVIALLRERPILRQISCDMVHPLAARVPPTLPVSHPTLHTLRLGITTPSELEVFGDNVTLPLLRDFSISAVSGQGSPGLTVWSSTLRLLERSQCQLETLTIPCAFDDEVALVDFLRSPLAASVTNLNLTTKVTDKFLRALTLASPCDDPEGHSFPILPRMSHLSLRWCSSSDGVLSCMIRSRGDILRRVEATLRRGSFDTDASLEISGVELDLVVPGWVDESAGTVF